LNSKLEEAAMDPACEWDGADV